MSKANQGGPAGQGSDPEVVRVLRAARAHVAAGWGQGWFGCGLTRGCKTVCAGVAIDRGYRELAPPRPIDDPAYLGALNAFRAAIRAPVIMDWNDAPGRTQAEVIAKLDEAIALASNASAAQPPSKDSQDPA